MNWLLTFLQQFVIHNLFPERSFMNVEQFHDFQVNRNETQTQWQNYNILTEVRGTPSGSGSAVCTCHDHWPVVDTSGHCLIWLSLARTRDCSLSFEDIDINKPIISAVLQSFAFDGDSWYCVNSYPTFWYQLPCYYHHNHKSYLLLINWL